MVAILIVPDSHIPSAIPTCFFMSFTITVMASSLIIYRIITVSKLDGINASRYHHTIEMVAESGVLYAIPLLIVSCLRLVCRSDKHCQVNGSVHAAFSNWTSILIPLTVCTCPPILLNNQQVIFVSSGNRSNFNSLPCGYRACQGGIIVVPATLCTALPTSIHWTRQNKKRAWKSRHMTTSTHICRWSDGRWENQHNRLTKHQIRGKNTSIAAHDTCMMLVLDWHRRPVKSQSQRFHIY